MKSFAIGLGVFCAVLAVAPATAGSSSSGEREPTRLDVGGAIRCEEALEQIPAAISRIDLPGMENIASSVGRDIEGLLKESNCGETLIVSYLKTIGMKQIEFESRGPNNIYTYEFYTPKFGILRRYILRGYSAIFSFDNEGNFLSTNWGTNFP